MPHLFYMTFVEHENETRCLEQLACLTGDKVAPQVDSREALPQAPPLVWEPTAFIFLTSCWPRTNQ